MHIEPVKGKDTKSRQVWISATQLPGETYKAVHNWLCGIAGEGEEVTPSQLGVSRSKFMFDRLFRIEHKDGHYEVVYSMSEDAELCFELFGTYH